MGVQELMFLTITIWGLTAGVIGPVHYSSLDECDQHIDSRQIDQMPKRWEASAQCEFFDERPELDEFTGRQEAKLTKWNKKYTK